MWMKNRNIIMDNCLSKTNTGVNSRAKSRNNWKEICEEAWSLYASGEYERALLLYHRAERLRPGSLEVKAGVRRCEHALMANLNQYPGNTTTDKHTLEHDESNITQDNGRTMTFMEWAESLAKTKPQKHNKVHPAALDYTQDVRHADRLSDTGQYLQGLHAQIGSRGSVELKHILAREISYLHRQSQFWRSQVPSKYSSNLYAARETQQFRRRTVKHHDKNRETFANHTHTDISHFATYKKNHSDAKMTTNSLLHVPQKGNTVWSKHNQKSVSMREPVSGGKSRSNGVNQIIEAVIELVKVHQLKQYQKVLTLYKQCISQFNQITDQDLEHKDHILCNLYCIVGDCYFNLDQTTEAITWYQRDLQLARIIKQVSYESRALGNIGRVYVKEGKYTQALEVWRKKEPLHDSDEEKAWLFHEMGYCHLTLGDGQGARQYGTLSLEAAVRCNSRHWMTEATLLQAQALVMLGELEEAVETFENGLELIKEDISAVEKDSKAAGIQESIEEIRKEIALRQDIQHNITLNPEQYKYRQ